MPAIAQVGLGTVGDEKGPGHHESAEFVLGLNQSSNLSFLNTDMLRSRARAGCIALAETPQCPPFVLPSSRD